MTAPVQPVQQPPKRSKRMDEMLRLAARIYARGGDDNDVASVLYHGYNVKLPGWEPGPEKGDTDATMSGKAGYVRGISMNALNGLTFGFGDEAVGSILGILTGEGAAGGIDTYRKELQQFNEQNKKAALASEIAGGLLLGGTGAGRAAAGAVGRQATTLGKVGMSAGIGAGAGGLAGAGHADGTLSDRARGAVVGGVLGAGIGGIAGAGLVPAVTVGGAGIGAAFSDNPLEGAAKGAAAGFLLAKGGKGVARKATNWLEELRKVPKDARTVSRDAREKWAKAIIQDHGSIDNAIKYATKLNQEAPVVAADLGENARDMTAAAASLRGPGKKKLVEELTTRQQDQGDRILSKLFRSFKLGVENAYDAADEIIATGKAASQPAYAKAYAQEIKVTDPIRKALNHPRLRQAYDMGRQIAFDEDYAGVMGSKATGAKEVPALALDKAGKVTNDMLPVRALDYMKRGLDSMIENAAESDKALLRQSARAFNKLLKDAIGDAELQSVDYKFAKAIFRGEREALESLQMGKGGAAIVDGVEVQTPKFHTKPPQVIEREQVLLSPTDRNLYRLGAMQDLAEWVAESTAKGSDVAKKLGAKEFGKSVNNMESRIRALFDDQSIADDVMDYLRGELIGSATFGKTQGSRTGVLQQMMADLQGGSGGVVRSAAGVATKIVDKVSNAWSDAMSDEISNLALKGLNGRNELLAFLHSLKASAPRKTVIGRVVAAQQAAQAQ